MRSVVTAQARASCLALFAATFCLVGLAAGCDSGTGSAGNTTATGTATPTATATATSTTGDTASVSGTATATVTTTATVTMPVTTTGTATGTGAPRDAGVDAPAGGSGGNQDAAAAGTGGIAGNTGGTGGTAGNTGGTGGTPVDGGPTPTGTDAASVDPCAGQTCSGHGKCSTANGNAACVCDSGYHSSALVCVSDAGLFGLAIPTDHPRLVFNTKNLATAKTWYAGHPLSPKDPTAFAMKGLLANDSTSCATAVASAKADSAAMSVSGTACDNCRWNGEQDLLVYDWCYNMMTATDRTGFEASFDSWIEHWRTQSWGGVPMHENNYYWGYLRNEFEWGVLSSERKPSLATAELDDVFNVRLKNDFYPAAGVVGGVGQEGAQYGPYVMGYASVPLLTADQMGRAVFEESPYYLGAVYAYIFETTPNGGIFSWNDDDGYAPGTPSPFIADYMVVAANHWNAAAVGGYARQWLASFSVEPSAHFKAVDDGVAKPIAFSGLPLDYFAAGPRYLFGRSSWSATPSTAYMLLLGDEDGVGHNHVDYGSFQIWRGGQWLSRESVGYGYSDLNVVGLGGNGSSDVRLAVAHNTVAAGTALPTEKGSPNITRLESQPGYSFASVDLSPAFASGQVQRDIVFVRSLETMVIFDRGATVFLAHCETVPTTNGKTATCTNGNQALVVNALLGTPSFAVLTEGSQSGQQRIEITTSGGTMLTVLQAKDASASALTPTVVDNGTSYTVTLAPSTSLQFVKGATSTGGSITIGGITSNFRSNVQPMSITASGPAWN
jgi:hypothetical protein